MKNAIYIMMLCLCSFFAFNAFSATEVVMEKTGDKTCYTTTFDNGNKATECVGRSKMGDKADKPVQIVREEMSGRVCFASTFGDGSTVSECVSQ